MLVDEAYNEMTDLPDKHSLADLVRAGENVIVTRTFSKVYGMAGMRMGYALASEENIARIRGYVTSFGGNVAGIAGAIASFNDDKFLAASLAAIREGREVIFDAVRACRTVRPAQPGQFRFREGARCRCPPPGNGRTEHPRSRGCRARNGRSILAYLWVHRVTLRAMQKPCPRSLAQADPCGTRDKTAD